MNIILYHKYVKELVDKYGCKNPIITELVRYGGYNKNYRHEDVDTNDLFPNEIDQLIEIVNRDKIENKDNVNTWTLNRLRNYKKLISDNGGTEIVKKLEYLVDAFKGYINQSEYKYLFKREKDENLIPYFVSDIKYERANKRHGIQESVNMTLLAFQGKTKIEKRLFFYKPDLLKSVSGILKVKGLYLATEESMDEYRQDLEKYISLVNKTGIQMSSIGIALGTKSGKYGDIDTRYQMIRDGVSTKVVVDDRGERADTHEKFESGQKYCQTRFWDKVEKSNGMAGSSINIEIDDEENEKMVTVMLPIHPYVSCFELDKYRWLYIHVSNLQEYEWDETLFDKLILNEEHKNLIDILMSSTDNNIEDIIKGKMSGVTVIATGPPGVGKTLTGEVFSEKVKRPLYVVQSSQLGIEVTEIEKNLQLILDRASRWGAILLIDEADVYIRKRGEDLIQNAIVGIFLRLIEYYRGILFMTSNRGDIIDDAIMSRATAWIKYDLPREEYLQQIWKVLAVQYRIDLSHDDIEILCSTFPCISGRSVRNILKLSSLLFKSKEYSVDSIIEISKYKALEGRIDG